MASRDHLDISIGYFSRRPTSSGTFCTTLSDAAVDLQSKSRVPNISRHPEAILWFLIYNINSGNPPFIFASVCMHVVNI